ncbi:hypothetical protein [Stutzerimonas marianensis]|uniref:Uncharacterized protein n=1 Tax=Stutzerimonas marianensis TaxID=2929513 RepID=A0A9X2ASJ7_9GAMM|nr:hypothetical protein [Pseudomonas marianensis]MCJ0973790.1 hypothetical protein [Pseudomonas marianensis]
MGLIEFILLYLVSSLFWKWVISWGGAQWLEGWKSFFIIDWFAWVWTAEQIRLYALVAWVFSTLFFLLGLFKPEWRF